MVLRRTGTTVAERCSAALCIFYYTGAIQALFFVTEARLGPAASVEPNEEARLAWLPLYLLVLLLSLPRLPRILAAMRANLPLLALLVLPLLSGLWSIEPGDTLRRGAALLASSLLGFYLAVRFSPASLMRLLLWGLGLTVVLSWVVLAAWPGRGVMSFPYEGAWRGIFTHKNALGQVMLLNLIVVLIALPETRRHRWLLWADLALSLILLVGANSKTYLVGGLLLGALGLSLRLWMRRSRQFLPMTALLASGAILAAANLDAILGLFGRDVTLTGRTDLWQAVWPMIEQRVLLGYGYQAFWINPAGPAAQIWSAIDWRAPNAHNGILEWWLGLGLVGLALMAWVFGRAVARATFASRRADRATSYWTSIFLGLFLLSGLSESDFLSQNDLLSMLFVATVIYCDATAARRSRRPSAMPLVPAATGRAPGPPSPAQPRVG
jgi:O-antigen ligase